MTEKMIEEELKQSFASEHREDEEYVLSVQNLPSLPRAEAWLKHVLKSDRSSYSTQEAVVYLISRGNDCSGAIENIIKTWKLYEKQAIEVCMREIRVHNMTPLQELAL